MADLRPFRGLRFYPRLSGDVANVLCPPYDIITNQEQEELYQRSPYNLVRLELGKEMPGDNEEVSRYTRAGSILKGWMQKGILRQDEQPSFYLMEDEYYYGGRPHRLKGLFAAMRLEEYNKGIVLPHEHTSPGPKEDRLRLMTATRANISPLFALYKDGGGHIEEVLHATQKSAPLYEALSVSNHTYRLWAVRDERHLGLVQYALKSQPLFLADGHHRYETALEYRNRTRTSRDKETEGEAINFVMACLVNIREPGFQIEAFHRLLYSLTTANVDTLEERAREIFEIERFEMSTVSLRAIKGLIADTQSDGTSKLKMALFLKEKKAAYILTFKSPSAASVLPQPPILELYQCNTWLLHEGLLKPLLQETTQAVAYIHDLAMVTQELQKEDCQGAVFLPPIKKELFEAIIKKGQRLPPKSTYFYPKLPSGLVINPLEGEMPAPIEIELEDFE